MTEISVSLFSDREGRLDSYKRMFVRDLVLSVLSTFVIAIGFLLYLTNKQGLEYYQTHPKNSFFMWSSVPLMLLGLALTFLADRKFISDTRKALSQVTTDDIVYPSRKNKMLLGVFNFSIFSTIIFFNAVGLDYFKDSPKIYEDFEYFGCSVISAFFFFKVLDKINVDQYSHYVRFRVDAEIGDGQQPSFVPRT